MESAIPALDSCRHNVWIVRVSVDLRSDEGKAVRFFGQDKKAAALYAKQLIESRFSGGGPLMRLTPVEQGIIMQAVREIGRDPDPRSNRRPARHSNKQTTKGYLH